MALLAGDSDNEKGKSILLAMKENVGFESNSERYSRISEADFERLFGRGLGSEVSRLGFRQNAQEAHVLL